MPETTSLTELEAVNHMLDAVGQASVQSLVGSASNVQSAKAVRLLRVTNLDVQADPWNFNTVQDYKLERDAAGLIRLPANFQRFKPNMEQQCYRLGKRGDYLYDTGRQTLTFTEDLVGSLTQVLDWEDLPFSARWYITVKAARRFATTKLNSDTAKKFTQEDEQTALVRLQSEDAELDTRTMAESSPHVRRMRRR